MNTHKKTPQLFKEGERQDKKMLLAIIFAAFGLLLFIAFALTLPWA